MRKLPPLVLAMLIVGVLLALFFAVTQRSPTWRRIPSGGAVRVHQVTWGTKHGVRFPACSWTTHFKDLFSHRLSIHTFGRLLKRPSVVSGYQTSTSNSAPSTVVWMLFDNTAVVPWEATLTTKDGQQYHTKGVDGGGHDATWEYDLIFIEFPIVVPKERLLQMQVRFDGKPFDYQIENPAYVSGSDAGPLKHSGQTVK